MEIKNARATTMFCLILGIQGIAGILVEQPENIAAMLSETAIFKCKSDKDKGLLEWKSYVDVSNKEDLWNGYFPNPQTCPPSYCLIESTAGQYNLKLTARNETAKHYICIESGEEQPASASLIVIESKLKCTCEKTLSGARLSCAIGYYGQWPPQVKWSRSDGIQVIEDNVTASNANGKVTSTLATSLTAYNDSCRPTDDNTTPTTQPNTVNVSPAAGLIYFTASVHFDKSLRPTEVTATNAPSYTDNWTSPAFNHEGITTQPSHSSVALIGSVVTAMPLCIVIVIVVIVCRRVNANVRLKRQQSLAEEQRQPEFNLALEEETTIANEHLQHQVSTDPSFGNEGHYTDLKDRSFSDQQYSRLHIYANASDGATSSTEYTNRESVELMQQSRDYYNIAGN